MRFLFGSASLFQLIQLVVHAMLGDLYLQAAYQEEEEKVYSSIQPSKAYGTAFPSPSLPMMTQMSRPGLFDAGQQEQGLSIKSEISGSSFAQGGCHWQAKCHQTSTTPQAHLPHISLPMSPPLASHHIGFECYKSCVALQTRTQAETLDTM